MPVQKKGELLVRKKEVTGSGERSVPRASKTGVQTGTRK